MANTDNQCKDLEVEDVFSKSKNTLADLYNLQKDIQETVYGYDFKKMQLNISYPASLGGYFKSEASQRSVYSDKRRL